MQQSDKISGYIRTVCEQIRWEKAHGLVSGEIENHLKDQRAAFIAEGLDEETATDKAIEEMGDPILVGSELDRAHRPKIEWSIVALTGIIVFMGFAVRIFVTYDTGLDLRLTNSIVSTILGIGCMTFAYYLDFTAIGRYPKTIYLGLMFLLLGTAVAGACTPDSRYSYVPYLLLLFPTAFAGIIYSMRNKGYPGVLFCLVSISVPGFIGLIIPSIPSVFLYFLNCLILLTFAIAKGWFNVKRSSAILVAYSTTLITSMIFFIFFFLSSPYRMERLLSVIDPSIDPSGAGYLTLMIRKLIANAKILGQGELLAGSPPFPNASTDYILTFLIHRLGWISFVAIMTVLLVFIIRSFILSSKQKSVLGKLVSASVLVTFTMEVVLYAANNLGFPLVYSLSLPLISHGGTAAVVNMTLIGIMLSVFKSGYLVSDNISPSTFQRAKLLEITDGRIIINLNTK